LKINAMKTDHPIYIFLRAGPEAFRVLTGGHTLSGAYRFSSLTIKSLERRLDGILEPDGHAGPAYVVEFQGQPQAKAWYNLLTKMGLYGEQFPEREVLGIGVLLREHDRPDQPAWANDSERPLCIVALDRFLPQWLEREPDNPYVAVFAPLVIEDDAELRRRAPSLWQGIRRAPLGEEAREALSQVLEFWFFERFRGLTAQEIWAMLNLSTPIQETRAYQSIFAEGKAEGITEGKAEGITEGKAEDLGRLLARRFGPVPDWAIARIQAAPIAQLDAWLDGILDADHLEALIGPEQQD
jgi:predicted transposase YdaD